MDNPEQTRAGLKAAYRRLLDELKFEHLLLAHGEPVIGTGCEELAALVAAWPRWAARSGEEVRHPVGCHGGNRESPWCRTGL